MRVVMHTSLVSANRVFSAQPLPTDTVVGGSDMPAPEAPRRLPSPSPASPLLAGLPAPQHHETAAPIRQGHAAFTAKMVGVMEYLDAGAPDDSLILGSSNPYWPAPAAVRDAAASWWQRDDPADSALGRDGIEDYAEWFNLPRIIPELRAAVTAHYAGLGITGDMTVAGSVIYGLLRYFLVRRVRTYDVVMSAAPIYGPFHNLIHEREGFLHTTMRLREDGYKLQPAALKALLDGVPPQRAKAFLLVHPDNPTGVVYSRAELTALSAVFVEYNAQRKVSHPHLDPLVVIADEVTRNILWHPENNPFVSIASLPGMSDFTYTITGMSKDNSPGFATAVGFGPAWLIKDLLTRTGGSADSAQLGTAYVFNPRNAQVVEEHRQKSTAVYIKHFQLVRDELIPRCNEQLAMQAQERGITGAPPTLSVEIEPQAGFQMLLRISNLRLGEPQRPTGPQHAWDWRELSLGTSEQVASIELAWKLRSTLRVEMIPGEGFGWEGSDMLFRMALSKRKWQLMEAFDRLAKLLLTY